MRIPVSRLFMAAASGALVLALGACDSGASAVAARDHSATTDLKPESERAVASAASPSGGSAARSSPAPADDPRDRPAPVVDGKPMWAATRRLAAQDAAQANFERNGADFGARNLDDWVAKAHAFVEHPPKGVHTLSRANGDTLYYDAKANVFAVSTKDGAPRTMFKPRDGAAYWEEQKTEGDSGRTASSSTRTRRAANDG